MSLGHEIQDGADMDENSTGALHYQLEDRSWTIRPPALRKHECQDHARCALRLVDRCHQLEETVPQMDLAFMKGNYCG